MLKVELCQTGCYYLLFFIITEIYYWYHITDTVVLFICL